MINYKIEISKLLNEILGEIEEIDFNALIEVPTDERNGDYAFPCFRLAKIFSKNPAIIASDIADKLSKNPIFEKVESVNAYVNMYISKEDFLKSVVSEVITQNEKYGKSNLGSGKNIVIDFSSPNIAKPFHIGHIRTTVIGNAIYKIYTALGYNVIRVNHLGDYGTQFGKLIVAFKLWGNKEAVEKNPIPELLSLYVKFHDEAEKNSLLEDEAREWFLKLEQGDKEATLLWDWFRSESLKEFDRVYKLLGIEFDSFAGESFYSDKMPQVIKELKEKNLLKDSNGTMIVDLEKFKLPPALITKKDGSTLYLTRDLATAIYRKNTYNFDKSIYVVGSQQMLHFQQVFKVLEIMGNDWVRDCVHVQFGMVALKDGTMSTRKGRVVFLEDVLNKAIEKTEEIIREKGVLTDSIETVAKDVGIGAIVFNELSHSKIKDYVFDWDKVLNFEGETGPYVQYTHARCCSLIRKSEDVSIHEITSLECFDARYINSEAGYELTKLIYKLDEVLKEAADRYEPFVLTRHIIKIAQTFNRFYNEERILVNNKEEKLSKLALVYATKIAIKNSLEILGINSPEKM